MSLTNLIYFVVIARENLQNLFQKLLKPKKLPSKSLPVEEIKKIFLIQADQHSKCFYHKTLWSFSFDINKKFKKKINFTIYTFSILNKYWAHQYRASWSKFEFHCKIIRCLKRKRLHHCWRLVFRVPWGPTVQSY